jgi:hypothetical protein
MACYGRWAFHLAIHQPPPFPLSALRYSSNIALGTTANLVGDLASMMLMTSVRSRLQTPRDIDRRAGRMTDSHQTQPLPKSDRPPEPPINPNRPDQPLTLTATSER